MKHHNRRQLFMNILATVFSPTVVRAAAIQKTRINIADFGARPDSTQDATAGLRAAIAACPNNGTVLEFPHGFYQFTDSGGNFINLSGKTDFEIVGNNSTLVFSDSLRPFSLNEMTAVSVHDLILDWKRAPFSQGQVTNLSSDGKQMDVLINSAFPVSGKEPVYSVRFYDQGERALRLSRGTNESSAIPVSVTVIGKQHLRITFNREISINDRVIAVLLHTRQGYATMINEVRDIELRNIVVNTAPGMAFAGTRVRDLTVHGCKITPAEGSPLVSSTADGVHFWSSRGRFLVEQCIFQGLCDDCINIHSFLLRGFSGNGQRQIVLASSNTINGSEVRLSEPMIPKRGDHIQILDQQTLTVVDAATVELVTKPEAKVVLNLDKAVSSSASGEVFISDGGQVPTLKVTGCHFENSNGCGVVTHADSVIENNTFAALGWAGVNCLVSPIWLEGPLIANVTIRQNMFRGCGRANRGSLLVHALRRAADGRLVEVTNPINTNVRVESNYFEDPLGTPIVIGATDGVVLSDNHFSTDRAATDPLKPKLAVQFLKIRNGLISNNTCQGLEGISVATSEKPSVQVKNLTKDTRDARAYCAITDQ